MNAVASATGEDFPFAPGMPQQQPPYLGFDHGGAGGGGMSMGQHAGGMQHHLYDGLDFAAMQFQADAPHHHQLLTLPSSLAPMAPPPFPMPMPTMPGMHGGDVYPALGMVKREGGAEGGGRIGLNLGRRTYFSPGDMLAVDRLLMRSRLGGVFGLGFGGAHHQPPRCQAEGCKADLSGAKHYHRRHKVCEYHSKASVVTAGSKQQRFCQQCSRSETQATSLSLSLTVTLTHSIQREQCHYVLALTWAMHGVVAATPTDYSLPIRIRLSPQGWACMSVFPLSAC
jgi:hypothetical protein